MKKILLIEDNRDLSNQIKSYLEQFEYTVDTTFDVESSRNVLEERYDLALLDINLPDGNGISLLKKLKEQEIKTIILTVKDDEDFIVQSLDSGADDYITKPFSLSVLRARIDVSLRDKFVLPGNKIQWNDFILDEDNIVISYKNKKLELTAKEYDMLRLFIKNPNRIFTREHLLDYFWDSRDNIVNDNTLTVTIKRIREKTDKSVITTIHGIGYRMDSL